MTTTSITRSTTTSKHYTTPPLPDFIDKLGCLRRHLASETVTPSLPTTLVHCSAGVGRTGVVLLVEAALSIMQLAGPKAVCLRDILKSLRLQRMYTVQTVGQYRFCMSSVVKMAASSRLIWRGHAPPDTWRPHLITLPPPYHDWSDGTSPLSSPHPPRQCIYYYFRVSSSLSLSLSLLVSVPARRVYMPYIHTESPGGL